MQGKNHTHRFSRKPYQEDKRKSGSFSGGPSGCQNKCGFGTYAEAEANLKGTLLGDNKRSKHTILVIYFCQSCGLYHIGTKERRRGY